MTVEIDRAHALPDTVVDYDFANDILAGFSRPAKSISSRWLYDARGSELFEQITELPEYYPTRTETAILQLRAAEIARATASARTLVEFGSGSSRKTEILLAAHPDLAAYAPIDVSASALRDAAERLGSRFPALRLFPTLGDFTARPDLPREVAAWPRLGFFPGSTIGNLTPPDATRLLAALGETLGPGAPLVVGHDLAKPLDRLLPAYDDAAGVTAAFNLNLLARINRELGGDFDLAAFRHEAVWNAGHSRVEMHLVSLRDHWARVLDRAFHFGRGEHVHTENSYKYTTEVFSRIAEDAGFDALESWTDDERLFRVTLLRHQPRR